MLKPFWVAVVMSFGLSGASFAQQVVEPQPIDEAGFEAFIKDVRTEALAKGIKAETLDVAFHDIKPLRRVVRRDRNQPEMKLTLERYLGIVLSGDRIGTGKLKAAEISETLDAVEARYGVAREYLIAIWGLETRFGAITGDIPLIPAIATLAYDKRRSAFFKKQLMAALEMLDKGYIGAETMKSSWAGAMGQPQFIPTSYIAYAVDFDDDGKRDIWGNEADVMGSIANYFKENGWRTGEPWGVEVRAAEGKTLNHAALMGQPEGSSDEALTRILSPKHSMKAWSKAGLVTISGEPLDETSPKAQLLLPDGPDGRAFLIHKNFKVFMSYNPKHLYALGVGILADGIAAQ